MKIKIDIDTEGDILDPRELIPYIKGDDYRRVLDEAFDALRRTYKHGQDPKLREYAEGLRDFLIYEMKERGLELE